jgi:hypothetical protein
VNIALKLDLKKIVKKIEIAISARKIAIPSFPEIVQPLPSSLKGAARLQGLLNQNQRLAFRHDCFIRILLSSSVLHFVVLSICCGGRGGYVEKSVFAKIIKSTLMH